VTGVRCVAALARRGVAHLTIPKDIQDLTCAQDEPSKRNVPGHNAQTFAMANQVADESDLRRAAELLNAGERIVIMAGRGAIGAGNELEQLAQRLGAVIV